MALCLHRHLIFYLTEALCFLQIIKKTILSPFLSKMTYSKLNISDNRIISQLVMDDKREEYLKYHRANILKGKNAHTQISS
ncbi:hypothetical protein BSPWISOXPB_2373 [uncultured Gammaproteobacteria bacterium]|nr:hypothetical protein BSPWISOXPB_2373 [uncultured Gammaproteobacteria bacterium]